MVGLFVGVALVNIGMAAASATSTLVGAAALGQAWSGAPNAAGVLGTAAGALALSRVMTRRGRRSGLRAGYATAVVGGAIAVAGVVVGAVPLLLVGMALLGIGNGAAQLSRYAAADLFPAAGRGRALSSIVWAGTVGGVLGPNLMSPSAGAAMTLHLPMLAGAFLAAALVMTGALAAATALPRTPAPAPSAAGPEATERAGLAALLRVPAVGIALAAMTASQLDMVAVMTMTPVNMSMHGGDLTMVGGVLSIHILGMFALSPLSGAIADRWGGSVTVVLGLVGLGVATVLAMVAPAAGPLTAVALFALGYGWNLCFIGGSSLLSRGLPEAQQTRLQGTVDALVWGVSAVASLGSGALLAAAGYHVLALVAGVVAAVPVLIVLAAHRRRLPAPPRPEPVTASRGDAG
jgi:MFS family permease